MSYALHPATESAASFSPPAILTKLAESPVDDSQIPTRCLTLFLPVMAANILEPSDLTAKSPTPAPLVEAQAQVESRLTLHESTVSHVDPPSFERMILLCIAAYTSLFLG